MVETDAGGALPRVVLICHAGDRMDAEGLAGWLATCFELVGVVQLWEQPGRFFTKLRREWKRVGLLRLLDVLAYRVYYRLRLKPHDAAWLEAELKRLRSRYPADLAGIPVLMAADPNAPAVRDFLRQRHPDMTIARCKFILKPELLDIPSRGTYVLHPGICPEYRNAHGCFWAFANRDLGRVGMTLLRADPGVDTGPMLLQASYRFDELRESAHVVQYRVVLENLEAIRASLMAVWQGSLSVLSKEGRRSAAWGQPQLSAYLRWKRAAARGKAA